MILLAILRKRTGLFFHYILLDSIVTGVAKMNLMCFEFFRPFRPLDAHEKKAGKSKLHNNHFGERHTLSFH